MASDDLRPVIINMPPIPREPFKSEADYQRAVETSQRERTWTPGGIVFIPEDRLVDCFVALVNATQAVGMGVLHDKDMTEEDARNLWLVDLLNGEAPAAMFDYVNGRPVKLKPLKRVNGGYEFKSDLYNRDSSEPAEAVIARVLSKSK